METTIRAWKEEAAHPSCEEVMLVYRLLLLDGRYALLITEEQGEQVLSSECLVDLTSEEDCAKRLFTLCVEGTVLPGMAGEVLGETVI